MHFHYGDKCQHVTWLRLAKKYKITEFKLLCIQTQPLTNGSCQLTQNAINLLRNMKKYEILHKKAEESVRLGKFF